MSPPTREVVPPAIDREPAPRPPQALPLGAPRPRRSLGTRRQRVVAGLVIVGALAFLLGRGLTNALDYYLTAKQAVAQRAQLGQEDFRQVGTTLQFTIGSGNVRVHVVSTGSPPELFHVGMPVVLDGHWQGADFASFQIMVQHGSNYVEAHPGKTKSASRST